MVSVISNLLYGNDHLVNHLYDLTEEKIAIIEKK